MQSLLYEIYLQFDKDKTRKDDSLESTDTFQFEF